MCAVRKHRSILADADAGCAEPAEGKPLAAVEPARRAVLCAEFINVWGCFVMMHGQLSCARKEGGPDQGPKGGNDSGC